MKDGLKEVAKAKSECAEAVIQAAGAFAAISDTSSYDEKAYALAAAKGGELKRARGHLAEVIENEVVAPARKVKQFADLFKNTALESVDALIEEGRRKYTAYRKAEEDRLKLAAEKAAAEAALAQKMEADHAEALAMEASRQEQDRILERAVAAEAGGDPLRAAAILDTPGTVTAPPPASTPAFIPPPMPPTKVARTAGEVRKKKRVGRIVDAKALLRAFAEGKLPLTNAKGDPIVTIKQSYLNDQAKSFGDKVGQYLPGVVCDEVEDSDFR